MKKYYLIRCPYCGIWQIFSTADISKAVFKCKYCNKTRKIKQKNRFGFQVIYKGPFSNPYIARYQLDFITGLKAKEMEK